ncbi:MAG: hypothetical protein ACP5QU_11175, partial [Anaerolineae bacterium]
VAGPPPEPEAPVAESVSVVEAPLAAAPVEVPKEAKKLVSEEEDFAKDGVSLDDLFTLKSEIFRTAGNDDEEEDEKGKKKDKKKKKKGVELVLDEDLGEVVGRKKHKRGGDDFDLDEEW